MGHRTKVVIAVDSHNEIAVRGKLGEHNFAIAETLLEAVNVLRRSSLDENVAARLAEALDEVSGVGVCDDFDRDPGMDVHVELNISTEDGSIWIKYQVDPGWAGGFEGSFEDFLSDYGSLEDLVPCAPIES